MASVDICDGVLGCLNVNTQPQRTVHPLITVVNRLHGQSDAQVARATLKHTDVAADYVVKHFVATAELYIVGNRRVVLGVDPVGHHHGCCHDQLEHLEIWITFSAVVVQECAPLQILATGECAWCGDEGGIAGETPLGTNL